MIINGFGGNTSSGDSSGWIDIYSRSYSHWVMNAGGGTYKYGIDANTDGQIILPNNIQKYRFLRMKPRCLTVINKVTTTGTSFSCGLRSTVVNSLDTSSSSYSLQTLLLRVSGSATVDSNLWTDTDYLNYFSALPDTSGSVQTTAWENCTSITPTGIYANGPTLYITWVNSSSSSSSYNANAVYVSGTFILQGYPY